MDAQLVSERISQPSLPPARIDQYSTIDDLDDDYDEDVMMMIHGGDDDNDYDDNHNNYYYDEDAYEGPALTMGRIDQSNWH